MAQQAPVQQNALPSRSGAKVTVACKMPNGLIIRGFEERLETENVLGGGTRNVTVHRDTGERVVISGTSVRIGAVPPLLFGGYRLTSNVPKDLWDQWYAANRDGDLVRNKLIFAHEDERRAEDEAKGYGSIKTGLEGIDPDNPGKSIRSNIHRLEAPKR